MNELALLLKILQGANLATPTIVGIIGTIRRGREQGKTDDEIQEESMQIALETDEIKRRDTGDQP